jgi:hypothetical protein
MRSVSPWWSPSLSTLIRLPCSSKTNSCVFRSPAANTSKSLPSGFGRTITPWFGYAQRRPSRSTVFMPTSPIDQ